MNDNQFWFLVQALLHISRQVSTVDAKINILLKNSQIDLSKEDAAVLEATKTVAEALAHIIPKVPPVTS